MTKDQIENRIEEATYYARYLEAENDPTAAFAWIEVGWLKAKLRFLT